MNPFQQSANALGGAIGTTQGIANLGFGNLNRFMNPYTNNVINRGMQDLNRARQMTLNDVGAQATAAGAFGGSRHGLVEAETNRQFADAAGDMSAQLRQQGFNTALGAAGQEQGLRMQAAGQLGGLGQQAFNTGQQINAMQYQSGAQQQQLQQQLIDAARQQYQGMAGAPQQGLASMIGAVSGVPIPTSTTTSQNPGILGLLTGGASILGSLGGAGLLPFCWVARAAFGAGNSEWLTVRQWMLTRAPDWLFRAYVQHGPELAAWIERHPVTKPLFRSVLRRLVKV